MKAHYASLAFRILLIAVLISAIDIPPALAAGVVGTGTSASCTETALDAALVGGGSITFNCGSAPHTILFSSAKSITVDTTLDGGGTITLDGQDSDRLFVVSDGAVLTLRNIVLAHGSSTGDGGAIYNGSSGADTPGAVILENSTIRDSTAGLSGGAIVSTGPLTITNSLLEGNSALNGGALYPRFGGAHTTIVSSTLRYNTATDTTNGWGGALLIWDGADVTIEAGEIFSNTARQGGGIYAFANSTLTINANTLRDNQAQANGGGGLFNAGTATLTDVILIGNSSFSIGGGGGLYNSGAITLTHVTLNGNSASANGGGLFNKGAATLTNVTLSGNTGLNGGGLYNVEPAWLTITNSTFSGNSADSGGGLINKATTLIAAVTNVTFSGNLASTNGGGLYNFGATVLTNVTFSGNSASANGGGLYNFDRSAGLYHVTLSGNTAGVSGGGIYKYLGTVAVRASIVTNSPSGGNCAGDVSNYGFNLSTDATCTGFNQVANVMLGPLADNGGQTLTHLPQPGSPAIDLVAVGCPPPATDQRGSSRPEDGDGNGSAACDVGAVEVGAAISVVYLPLAIK